MRSENTSFDYLQAHVWERKSSVNRILTQIKSMCLHHSNSSFFSPHTVSTAYLITARRKSKLLQFRDRIHGQEKDATYEMLASTTRVSYTVYSNTRFSYRIKTTTVTRDKGLSLPILQLKTN